MAATSIDFFPTEYRAPQNGGQDQMYRNPQQPVEFGGAMNNNFIDNAQNPFADEPPILEELGIDKNLIKRKIMAVLNPRKSIDPTLLHDTDLGGPFIFALLLGLSLIFSGKLHLGYVFGYSIFGSGALYLLLNLMTENSIGIYHTMSVLGYSLPPIIVLAVLSVFLPYNILSFFGLAAVLYCTYSASSMFVAILEMKEQQGLLAYPMGLLYALFALIVMF